METKNILIPFVGFYESIASQKAEDIAFQNFVHENNIKDNPTTGWMDKPEDMTDAEQSKFWDYYDEKISEIRKSVAEDYIRYFNDAVGINAKFESIDSPRQYNYTTDRLFVDVPIDELISLYNKTSQEALAEMIKERHTSRDGFDSYYENDITDESWHNPAKYDHNQWCTVIEAYVKQHEVDLDELYYI